MQSSPSRRRTSVLSPLVAMMYLCGLCAIPLSNVPEIFGSPRGGSCLLALGMTLAIAKSASFPVRSDTAGEGGKECMMLG